MGLIINMQRQRQRLLRSNKIKVTLSPDFVVTILYDYIAIYNYYLIVYCLFVIYKQHSDISLENGRWVA